MPQSSDTREVPVIRLVGDMIARAVEPPASDRSAVALELPALGLAPDVEPRAHSAFGHAVNRARVASRIRGLP